MKPDANALGCTAFNTVLKERILTVLPMEALSRRHSERKEEGKLCRLGVKHGLLEELE